MSSAVRACAADSYLASKAIILDAVRDQIRAKGYRPAEIAQRLPSTRREFILHFMAGRDDATISLRRAYSLAEAVGVIVTPTIRIDAAAAPRVAAAPTSACSGALYARIYTRTISNILMAVLRTIPLDRPA